MKFSPFSRTTFGLWLLTISTHFLHLIHADSNVFSKFIGDTIAVGPTTVSSLSFSFSQCTQFISGLPALPATSGVLSMEMEKSYVDIVCFACPSLGQRRIDSCCAETSSSACFDQFTAAVATDATAPAATSAGRITAAATATSGTVATAKSSSNAGGVAQNMDIIAGSVFAGLVGVAALVL